MKTLSFNFKPLALSALFIVFAASFNTAAACETCHYTYDPPCGCCDEYLCYDNNYYQGT